MIILYIILGLALLPFAVRSAVVVFGLIVLGAVYAVESLSKLLNKIPKKALSFVGNSLLYITFLFVFAYFASAFSS